jgi:hypothetical protein
MPPLTCSANHIRFCEPPFISREEALTTLNGVPALQDSFAHNQLNAFIDGLDFLHPDVWTRVLPARQEPFFTLTGVLKCLKPLPPR